MCVCVGVCVCVCGDMSVCGGVWMFVCVLPTYAHDQAAGGDLVDGDKEDDGLGPLLVRSLLVLRAQGT